MAEGHATDGKNSLLTALHRATNDGAMEGLERVSLTLKQELYTANEPIDYVYFPLDGVISMLAKVEGGLMVEVATVGNEGMIGLPLFLGASATPGVAFAQIPGDACRMGAARFKECVNGRNGFSGVLHRYTQALMTQISQGTACNRAHNNRQRCARWLLLTHDRVGKDEFPLTQEFLSQMMGVRRATVSEVARELQENGGIEYSRGVIRIVDRPLLEAASCVCYRIIRDEYERMYAEIMAD
jgi:CRP-like cAMP-binding protein